MICKDHEAKIAPIKTQGQSANTVSADVERLLSPKSLEELSALEKQIEGKLQSKEPIDVEYWEQLLRNVAVYKARAELDAVYKSIIESRLNELRGEQREQAAQAKEKLRLILTNVECTSDVATEAPNPDKNTLFERRSEIQYSRELDPEPLLKLHAEDKGLDVMDEKAFMDRIVSSRRHRYGICDTQLTRHC